jgi:tetratricopeptide (TPR) repeat protein
MARIIPEKFWRDSFLLPNGRYNGHKFERLALDLLEILYGHGWQATLTTHDGSRDFERHDKNGSLWAECKAYNERLSVYPISPTLVMALIEDPHTVIIVSRSSLNENAVRHLAAYQSVSTKRIAALDGLVLDNAILGTGVYAKYFSRPLRSLTSDANLLIRTSITPDAFSEPVEGDLLPYVDAARAKRPIYSVRGSFIRIDFSIKNLNALTETSVKLSMLPGSLDRSLRVVSFGGRKSSNFSVLRIAPAGIMHTSLLVQPKEARRLLTLPSVVATGPACPDRAIKTGSVSVSHLYQIDIVGSDHLRILEEASSFVRSRRKPIAIVLEGASGTGKSRLTLEIAKACLEENFRCHLYDPEFEDAKATDRVLRDLIADISELPRLHEISTLRSGGLEPETQVTSVLARALYDQTFDVWSHVVEVVSAIVTLLEKTPRLLAIDNIQFTSDQFVGFIESLLFTLEHSNAKRVVLLFAVNTDFVAPESRISELLGKLRVRHAEPVRGLTIYHSRLREFDIDDVSEFVGAAIAGKRSSKRVIRLYEMTLKLLMDRVQPRPLNLWQGLMYLVDEGVISWEDERLELTGDETLLNRLHDLPAQLHDLLMLRWSRIKMNSGCEGITPTELDATVRAAYLLGSDNQQHLLSLGATQRGVSKLIRAGILVSQRAGRVQFFHSQVFSFFRSRFMMLDTRTAKQLKKKFDFLRVARLKFQQYFILCHFSKSVTATALAATVREMESVGLTIDYWKQYADILLSYLFEPGRRVGKTSLKGVRLIGDWQQRLESLNSGAATLRDFLTNRILNVSRKSLPGESLFEFYKSTINALLAIYEDRQALELIDTALSDLRECRFLDDNQRDSALATVLNRRAATLKNFGEVEEALAAGREGLARFERIADYSMLVETLFDIGSILLSTHDGRVEGRKSLERGCSIFRAHKEKMREPAPCRYFYVRAEIGVQDHDFIKAYDFCRAGLHHAERVGNRFWGIRLILLEVTARLLAGRAKNNLKIIEQLLVKARDWANVSQAERSRWAISYLEGKFLAAASDDRAGKAFSDAVSALAQRLRSAEQVSWRSPVLRDIAASCRRGGFTLDESAISRLKSRAVRSELAEILKMSDESFRSFQKSRVREAAFSFGTQTVEAT